MTAVVPFPTAVEKFPRIRQSLASTFDSCALAAKFDMELRHGWSSHPAARGQLVHRVFAKCLEAMEAAGEILVPINVALEVFEECLRQHDVPMDGDPLMNDHVVPVSLREIAEARIIVRTWAKYSRYDVHKIAGIEKRLSTILRYPNPAGGSVEREFTGKLDLLMIDGEVATVVDYKTSWAIPSEGAQSEDEDLPPGDNVSEQGYFQMRAYALLVFATYPRINRVVMREVYPRYLSGNATDPKGQPINPVRQATIDRYLLPEITAEMSALVERLDRSIETGHFRPAPGKHCSYCPRPDACTIFPTARAEGRIGSPEEAEKIAGRVEVLDALKSQSTKALRAWSSEHGDVQARGNKSHRVYGPVVRKRTHKPTPDQVERAVANGVDPKSLFVTEEHVVFCFHKPEEEHPSAAAARKEEEILLSMQRELDERKAARR